MLTVFNKVFQRFDEVIDSLRTRPPFVLSGVEDKFKWRGFVAGMKQLRKFYLFRYEIWRFSRFSSVAPNLPEFLHWVNHGSKVHFFEDQIENFTVSLVNRSFLLPI